MPISTGGIVAGWEKQARTQVDAAGERGVAWYFAEPEPAERARKLFESDPRLRKIKVIYEPAEVP